MTTVTPILKPEPKQKKTRSTAWRQHEQRSAKKLVAADEPDPKLHKPRTGDMKDGGGDTESLRWEQECKHTDKSQYILKADTVIKLVKAARAKGKRPIFNLQYTRLPWQLCFVLWEDVKEIIALQRDYEQQEIRIAELEAENQELRLTGNDNTNKELFDKLKSIKRSFGYAMNNLREVQKELKD